MSKQRRKERRWRRMKFHGNECREVMSELVGAAAAVAILVIVINPEDGLCRENETDDRDRVEVAIPITCNRPSTLRGAIK